jgi:hypothetical protein
MIVTKTKFINYSRCPRTAALDNLHKNNIEDVVDIITYKEEENKYLNLQDLKDNMYEDGEDLIDAKNEQLEIMLPFFSKVEQLAGHYASLKFPGTFKYSEKTYNQESFDTIINGIKYLCYVDIYNETEDSFNIIEVKASTTNILKDLSFTKDKEEFPIFYKDEKGIYHLAEEVKIILDEKKYNQQKAKLYDRFSRIGKYVFDLAIQRYIIEKELIDTGKQEQIDKVRYYLSLLNAEYVFDGKFENGEPVYDETIIDYVDLTEITKDLQDSIDVQRKKVEQNIYAMNISQYPLGNYCEHKKNTKCVFVDQCFNHIPKQNSVLNILGNLKDNESKINKLDLINQGIINLLDVPIEYIQSENGLIQRQVVQTGIPYQDKEKINAGIEQITYPIYHLDFETFPCPLPKYKGEKCYSQSVFQYSLHIEKEEGICDKEKDHFHFLATDHSDQRRKLVEKMLNDIDINSKGTVLVYNVSFEKTRIKELGEIFPEYKDKLKKLSNMLFDLMYVVKTKNSLYQDLGFEESRAKLFNYYHTDMNGSYSIKKILPLFTNLSYDELEVANGIDAIVAYGKLPTHSNKEKLITSMIEYCKQDTWAMVEILLGLRRL